jgi:hypothetical protein
MNQRLLEELAHQHVADLQHRPRRESGAAAATAFAATSDQRRSGHQHRQSLRERTGWTLVGLGLRMAAAPRPVR